MVIFPRENAPNTTVLAQLLSTSTDFIEISQSLLFCSKIQNLNSDRNSSLVCAHKNLQVPENPLRGDHPRNPKKLGIEPQQNTKQKAGEIQKS